MKIAALFILSALSAIAAADRTLPGTPSFETTNDLSREMVAGIDKFLMRETAASIARRTNYWRRDFSSSAAYEKSVEENRLRFRTIMGATDQRLPVTELEFISTTTQPSLVAETDLYAVHAVRWPVFEGVHGEGLLVQPKDAVKTRVVALPDADQTPEMLMGLVPGIPAQSQFRHPCAVAVRSATRRKRVRGVDSDTDRSPGHMVGQRALEALHEPAAPRVDLPTGL
jgi:hypothetical protein